MLDKILALDRSLFLGLNSLHASWLDPVMNLLTGILVWIPLFAFILFLLIRIYGYRILTIIASVAVLLLISDQISVMVKNDVQRLRPSNDPSISANVHTVNDYRGGKFGYYSSHASNSFAVAVFISLLMGKKNRYMKYLCVLWALVMSYTRIYLGVHYPLDIISGAVAGCLLGWFVGRITLYILSLQGIHPNRA